MAQNKEASRDEKKIKDKELEDRLLNLIWENDIITSSDSASNNNNKLSRAEKAYLISSLLQFRTAKRLQKYSIILLAATIVFSAAMISVALLLAYVTGLI